MFCCFLFFFCIDGSVSWMPRLTAFLFGFARSFPGYDAFCNKPKLKKKEKKHKETKENLKEKKGI